jgi:hypothetical protein
MDLAAGAQVTEGAGWRGRMGRGRTGVGARVVASVRRVWGARRGGALDREGRHTGRALGRGCRAERRQIEGCRTEGAGRRGPRARHMCMSGLGGRWKLKSREAAQFPIVNE